MKRSDRYLLLAVLRIIVFMGAIILCTACERERSPQPPNILFGQQECDECRMIISDERYAAAMVLEEPGGDFRSVAFDDIGCLLQHEQSNGDSATAARYVRDQADRVWLNAESAVYVHSAALETPMAFGLAALADRGQADELLSQLRKQNAASEILDWETLRDRFASGTLHARTFTGGTQP